MVRILEFILMLIAAYLIGSIPSGIIVGKLLKHKDLRKYGSHNIGTTNAFRVLGPLPGVIVLAMDILKGTLAASLPIMLHYPQHWLVLIVGLFAVFGHTCSIFIHFQGGKAVATSAGIVLAYNPLFFLVAAAVFVTILLLTSTASLASLLGMIIITIISLFFHDWLLTAVAVLLTLFFFYRHRDNLKRLKAGKENMLPFGLAYYLRKKHQQK